ncbi:bacillithiol biosynthesis cysteine-adding enzyme BshC [Ureibacillus sp. MALMAid1270]|uniref:bacillithiol biosynthesis cysteine-adding enzyme BshC n=1 Tax=Ureibacillus sp. MALMAid1270 TaxID=3411629 RepID=UPI003BA70EA7
MKLDQVTLPVNNNLLSAYWSGSEMLHNFYEYQLREESYLKRAEYLKSKQYDTKQLSDIILKFMEPYGITEKITENLAYLADGSPVIVGGQQAGILTGPLYSIHKAISVILLAKKQTEKLGVKVIPLFWIAGEDHDIEEINHTYTIYQTEPKKRVYRERNNRKTMASTTEINKVQLKKTIDEIFKDFGETAYTQELYQFVLSSINDSETFTDFFVRCMNSFFKDEGLLMIDAAYPPFRRYESDFFKKIIEKNEKIAEVVVNKEQLLNDAGFGKPIEATLENANLFFVQDGERFLLERVGNLFINETSNIKFAKDELLEIALNNPEKLSNNVVTRPLMQEMTIPVLAFVGGPGELAYWATLKDAFEVMDLQMPIIVPRLNITLISRKVEQLLEEYKLTVEDVFVGKVKELKNKFLESIQDEEAKEQINQLQRLLENQYQKLSTHLNEQQLHLDFIIEKNINYHAQQFEYLKSKIEQQVLLKHDKIIRQFNTLSSELYPNDNYQERVFNPYQYLNIYGPTLISELLELPFDFSNSHYIVRM